MPTDFTALPRKLEYPLDRPETIEAIVSEDNPCGLPEFPEDNDERITVLFRLSLNEFVALASAIDVGSDIAYGADGLKVWWIWVASVMCASFCEEMAECVSDPESAFTIALADALRNNPALAAAIAEALPAAGAAVPGRSLTPSQSAADILPENVRDEFGECIPDALWGAVLYLVQSGNRAITDFFEILENASNTLEASAIISQNIPAAGSFAASAAEFADQLLENFQEGYAAAYTEEFENDLACALFCAAIDGCELTPDMLNSIMSSRLPDAPSLLTFQAVMNYFGAGTFLPGAVIADAMFTIYFTALQFGQQFGEQVGIKPLTDLMSLGADQLASDNWEVLCECSDTYCGFYDFTADDYLFVPGNGFGSTTEWVDGTGWRALTQPGQFVDVMRVLAADAPAPEDVTMFFGPATGSSPTVALTLFLNSSLVYSSVLSLTLGQTEQAFNVAATYTGDFDHIYLQVTNSAADGTNVITGAQFSGADTLPSWLSDAEEC